MLHQAWIDHLRMLRSGHQIGPRGQGTREVLDSTLTMHFSSFNLLVHPDRKLNYRFAVAEWIWMMFGHSAVEPLAQYNGIMRNFSDDGVWLTGAYGPHVHAQQQRVLSKLREDAATRQAVIVIPRPNVYQTKDEPCTLALQFLNRDGELHCIVTMRSSDAWLGVPYDVYSFSQIQNCYAGELGLARGRFVLHMGSAHLYDRDAEKVDKVLENAENTKVLLSPDLPGLPPQWLEAVMLYRDRSRIPNDPGPWARYAEALLAPTSDGAYSALSA